MVRADRGLGAENVQWMRDGLHIIFDTSGRVYEVKSSGSGLAILARNRTYTYRDMRVSPDGAHIAYRNNIKSSNYVMSLNGGRTTPLLGCWCGFDWSPDGTQLAIVNARALWVVNVDGGGLTQVTPYLAHTVWNPIWRPNPQ